jgi:hypothetical protein
VDESEQICVFLNAKDGNKARKLNRINQSPRKVALMQLK